MFVLWITVTVTCGKFGCRRMYMDPLLIVGYLSRVLLNVQYLLYMVVEKIKERSHGKHMDCAWVTVNA